MTRGETAIEINDTDTPPSSRSLIRGGKGNLEKFNVYPVVNGAAAVESTLAPATDKLA